MGKNEFHGINLSQGAMSSSRKLQLLESDCGAIVVTITREGFFNYFELHGKKTLQIGSSTFYVLQQRGNTEAYLKHSRTSTIMLFARIANHFQPVNYICKELHHRFSAKFYKHLCNKQKPVAQLTILTMKHWLKPIG